MTNLDALLAKLREAAPVGEPAPFIVDAEGTAAPADELGTLTTTYLHAVVDFVEAASATRSPSEIAGLLSAVSSAISQTVYLDELAASLSPAAFA
jgi:hypothetical protein